MENHSARAVRRHAPIVALAVSLQSLFSPIVVRPGAGRERSCRRSRRARGIWRRDRRPARVRTMSPALSMRLSCAPWSQDGAVSPSRQRAAIVDSELTGLGEGMAPQCSIGIRALQRLSDGWPGPSFILPLCIGMGRRLDRDSCPPPLKRWATRSILRPERVGHAHPTLNPSCSSWSSGFSWHVASRGGTMTLIQVSPRRCVTG